MKKILTVEEITDRISNAKNLADKCRWKVGVLMEYFELLSHEESGFEFDDYVAWARGISKMCADVKNELLEAGYMIARMDEHLKLYSLDMEKVKKENKHLKSIGIDNLLEPAEVTT
jgi:hypothetical protein